MTGTATCCIAVIHRGPGERWFRLPIGRTIGATAASPEIDGSSLAADPRDYGMIAKEYILAESRAFFADFIGRVGLNL